MEENNITVDKAVQTIKGAILRAQAQASQSSNAIQLSLYYGIGRYVSINLQQAHWGTLLILVVIDFQIQKYIHDGIMPPINLYELRFDKVYIKIINSSNLHQVCVILMFVVI